MFGEGTLAAGGREAADEDTVIGLGGHAETVAEESAAGEGALGVAGKDGDGEANWTSCARGSNGLDEFAGEAALADASAAGKGDDPGRFAGCRGEASEDLVGPF